MLRSGDRPCAEQELWALLTVYQLIRMAMTAAAESVPGTDPDRASFTAALEAARDQVTGCPAASPDSGDPADTPAGIGRAVLDSLLPARRARYSARKVKCATSRYLNRDDGPPQARHRHNPRRDHHPLAPSPGPARCPQPRTRKNEPA